ncbi:WD40 repeat-like protein [Ceratobasidium sp. AG-I]|nr:WD40 repeat-like protein [Ceratobasidium sp. AG-I]
MSSHPHLLEPLPADSDTDESSFWSTGDTSMSSNTSTLPSDTSMSVRMDVVRFDWPSSSKHTPSSDSQQKIHRVRSAPNLSPDRFIPRHSTEDDTHLQRSTISTPRSVRLARHLGFVIGDGQPESSSEGNFEERLRRARRESNASQSDQGNNAAEEGVSFARRAMAGTRAEMEQSITAPSTGFYTPSARSMSPTQPMDQLFETSGRDTLEIPRRDAPPSPFQPETIHHTRLSRPTLHHSISETSLNYTTSRLTLRSESSYRAYSPETSIRESTPAISIRFPSPETSLRQLPHERDLLLRSASTLLSPTPHTKTDVVGIGASGLAMSLGMGMGTGTRTILGMRARGTSTSMSGTPTPSPSSRYHMQRAPIHVYDAPEILEDYYASPFAWNHSTLDHFSKPYTHASSSNSPNKPSAGSGSIRSRRPPSFSTHGSASDAPSTEQYPGGMLACALGVSVFFSRVSGSRLLCIERLCTAEAGSGLQSAVEWGTHVGGWGHALAIGQTKGGLSIWDACTKQQITRLRPSSPTPTSHPSVDNANTPEPSQVCAMSWNRNLLAAGLNGSALLWDLRAPPQSGETEGAASRLVGHGSHKVCGVRWREDGEMLATGGDDNIVCVWDIRMPRRPVVSSTDPSVDTGPNTAGSNSSTTADSGPPTERTPIWRKRRHTGAVKALAWCPWAPNIVASGGGKQDGTVCFWNVQTGTLKETLALGSQITSISFSPVCREFVTTHGFRAISSSANSTTAPGPARFRTYDPHEEPAPLQDTANSIVTHSYPSLARVAHVPNLHGMRISHASLSPDGSRLMTGGTFEALVMWNVWGSIAKDEEEGIGSFVGMIR